MRGLGPSFALLMLLLAFSASACGGGSDGSGSTGEARYSAGGDAAGSADMARATGADTALVRLASEVLPEVEERSRIVAVRPPALATSSKEELERFLSGALEEQLSEDRAEAVGATYARLGLLPDTVRLAALLRSLLLEQVVGYYDPSRDTLYVVQDAPESQLEPILVHELVHALQDQRFDLDSLMRSVSGSNDRGGAAQAALEGHATYVMMEWLLARQTGAPIDLTAMPDLGGLLGGLDPTLLAGTPVLRDAPAIVRESMLFPYVGGLVFLQRLWSEDPARPLPFGADLPESTEQVLHPDRFLGHRDHPSEIEFRGDLAPTWQEVHSDGLGELEVRVFLQEHLQDPEEAAGAAQGWDGDRYRLLRDGDAEVLIWVTVWDSERDAAEFEDAARRAFRNRYAADTSGRRVSVERGLADGRPVVLILDTPGDLEAASLGDAARYEIVGGLDG